MDEVFLLYEYEEDYEKIADTPLVYATLDGALAEVESRRIPVVDVETAMGTEYLPSHGCCDREGEYRLKSRSKDIDMWIAEPFVKGTEHRVLGAPLVIVERVGVNG